MITNRIKNFNCKKFMKDNILLFFLIVLCIVVSVIVPIFLSTQNIINVLSQIAINAMLATGMTFVIIGGGIDLSVGSVAAFAGIIATSIMVKIPDVSILLSLLISIGVSIVVGVVCGGFSALTIAKLKEWRRLLRRLQ